MALDAPAAQVRDGGRGQRAEPLLLPRALGARPRRRPRRALAQRRPRVLQLRRLRLRERALQLRAREHPAQAAAQPLQLVKGKVARC